MKNLLPSNSTEFERGFELAARQQIQLNVDVIKALWNPQSCPLNLLPWLAWALSVDVWDNDWPEEVKRNMVKNSIDVHRHKGTVHAVRTAVEAVYSNSEVREWFSYGGDPYKFKVNIDVNSPNFDWDKAHKVVEVANSAKNVRSILEAVQVIVNQSAQIPKIAVVLSSQNFSKVHVNPVDIIPDDLLLHIGVSINTINRTFIEPDSP